MDFKQTILDYFSSINSESLLKENFNEKSFQHNLGEYIKSRFNGEKYIVQYERNINYFSILKKPSSVGFKKKEMDIAIVNDVDPNDIYSKGKPVCVIEIKYLRKFTEDLKKETETPTTCAIGFLDDIEFLEQCKKSGVKFAFSILLTDSDKFCRENSIKKRRKCAYSDMWEVFDDNKQPLNKKSVAKINSISAKEINKHKPFNIKRRYKLAWNFLLDYTDEKGHKQDLYYILEDI